MVPGMSAASSPLSMMLADDWPTTSIAAGVSAAPVRHAVDLARLFPVEGGDWSDRLVVETRRQLAGCLAWVEMDLRRILAQAPALAGALGPMPDAVGWTTLSAHPALMGPELVAHMRLRAGLGLLLRQQGAPGDMDAGVSEPADFSAGGEPDLADCAAALAMAEGRWAAPGLQDGPIKPDMPAEYFAELVWIAAASLCAAMIRAGTAAVDNILEAVDAAGAAMLARHDEGAGALGLADRLVRMAGAQADEPTLLGRALEQRRFLLFGALAARRLRLPTPVVMAALVDGPLLQVAALCHAIGGGPADYGLMLMALRPVRPALGDAMILSETERYAALTAAEADAVVAMLRVAAPLREGLAQIARLARP
ncbi:hypothetical protein GGR44_000524 [Sphingobium fontiphilum]|uniref:DUF2336 domain-containing protein n=2 Tax=Sphingobium fontiphilum TaxID=944425 RepID=A0A7W6DJB1_9SPHN|nr:hypothetical protein [Sphingobium fontiphilum]